MPEWKQLEGDIAAKRTARCQTTLQQLLGGEAGKLPRVGLCFSGGGWRAMSSGCAVLDALATPLEPSETVAGVEGVKLLDTVTHAFGLSGGSWCLFTTLAGGQRNPFHNTPNCGEPGAPDMTPHPWLHGPGHCFRGDVHDYKGLQWMLNGEHVSKACYRGPKRRAIVGLSSKVMDSTFVTALGTKSLGPTLVERWANFLANDILNFKDSGLDRASAEAEANQSRQVKLSSLQTLVDNGDFPFAVCSAIADRSGGGGLRLYDWVEFSPYFIRNPVTGAFTESVDDATAHFSPIDKANNRPPVPMRVHHFMAVCGSAFACDVGAVIPKDASKLVREKVALNSDPVIGKGLSEIAAGPFVANCRDAGIDFNVPFPPMLPEAQRDFDVIIAVDAGADSVNAYELERAVELGYLKLSPDTPSCWEKFGEGRRVRVYRGLNGHPSVIYFLALTKRPTSQIVYTEQQILADVNECRTNALEQLIPALMSELRLAKAGGAGAGAAPVQAHVAMRVKDPKRLAPTDDGDGITEAAPTGDGSGAHRHGTFSSVAESLINAAAANGLVSETIDNFLVVENAVFGSMPPATRQQVVAALEAEALAVLTGGTPPKPLAEALAPFRDALQVVLELGIVAKVDPANPASHEVALSCDWADFYAATAVARHELPSAAADHAAALKALQREGVPVVSAPEHLSKLLITTPARPTSRFCLVLGSAASKIRSAAPASDILDILAKLVRRRIAEQTAAATNSGATADTIEALVAEMYAHTVDFFGEVLPLAADAAFTAADCETVAVFSEVVVFFLNEIPKASGGKVAASFAASLLAEAVARHPTEYTLVLLRLLCEDRAKGPAVKNAAIAPLPPALDASGKLGAVAALAKQPALLAHPEDLLRIAAAAYELPVDQRARREAVLSTLAALGIVVDYNAALKHCFPSVITPLIQGRPLDDAVAVDTILGSTSHSATAHDCEGMRGAISAVFCMGAGTQLFRQETAKKCLDRGHYWDFLASCTPVVHVPPAADAPAVDAILSFAERSRSHVRRVEAPDTSKWTQEQRQRLERINSLAAHVLHTAKTVAAEVKTKVAGKIADVGGAAKGFIGGFLKKS